MKPTKALFCATGILGLSSIFLPTDALAVVNQDQTNKKLLQQMQQMQQEISTLNAEVQELRGRQSRVERVQTRVVGTQARVVTTQQRVVTTQQEVLSEQRRMAAHEPSVTPGTGPHGAQSSQKIYYPSIQVAGPNQPVPPHLQGERLTQGITVTTSPLLGLRSDYDASDLVVNISTMNEDLRLLQQREKLVTELRQEGVEPIWADRSLIELSGALEGQGVYQKPFQGRTNDDIDLTRAEFDTLAYVSPAVLGLLSMTYDNSPLPANIQGAGQRFANSRIFLKRGFITIGNLGYAPFYFSLGQMFAPFGAYTSEMLDSPMTQSIGQVNQREALLGFYEDGLYGSGYVFNGDAASPNSGINDGGVNLGYKHSFDKFTMDVGGGYLGNMADTLGLQKTGAPTNMFQGFGFSTDTEQLQHRVGAANLHGELDIGQLTLVGEYVGATNSFAEEDLSYNNDGARPRAMHVEGDYGFKMFERFPSIFTLAYDHSWQGLSVNIPKDSYIAELNTSFWKNTIETLEYRHDQNYPTSDVSGGSGFPVIASLGGTQDTVMLQAGIYF